jgi:ribonuclease HI
VIIATPAGQVTELGGGAAITTNNKMELTGAIAALSTLAATPGRVAVYTDSTYVIQGIGGWLYNWKRRGWKTATGADVMNRELWEELDALASSRGARSIAWHYVRGHSGIPGNERVDEIADSFATKAAVELYDGPLLGYPVAIFDLPDDTGVPPRSKSSPGKVKGAAYSYLSVVDGKPMRHATWQECEARVKGRAGAKFKKAASAADEAAILGAWRFRPDDL